MGETPLVPMVLYCPVCDTQHFDEGEWKTRPHKTHQCQECRHEWRPFEYPTVGVACEECADNGLVRSDSAFGPAFPSVVLGCPKDCPPSTQEPT